MSPTLIHDIDFRSLNDRTGISNVNDGLGRGNKPGYFDLQHNIKMVRWIRKIVLTFESGSRNKGRKSRANKVEDK